MAIKLFEIENWIWGRIKLLYMVRNIFWGRYRLSLFIIPKDLEILFDIFVYIPSHMSINGQPKEIKILCSH